MDSSERVIEDAPPDVWLVRPCEMYRAEYKDCKSIKARFHQYFIYAKTVDCEHWKKDFDNCILWRKTHDVAHLEEIIKSEKIRKLNRLSNMLKNDVWKLREKPLSSEEWNKPLPAWMQEKFSKSYLQARLEYDNQKNSSQNKWQCTIL